MYVGACFERQVIKIIDSYIEAVDPQSGEISVLIASDLRHDRRILQQLLYIFSFDFIPRDI